MSGRSERLGFLLDVAERERRHLVETDARLFSEPIDVSWVTRLEERPELSERVDAFSARFGRLHDTLGNRLIPELLRCLQETPGSALDNFHRMEQLGLLPSAASWIEARNLRNRLIHDYVRDPEEFVQALHHAHDLVPLLVETCDRLLRHARSRCL